MDLDTESVRKFGVCSKYLLYRILQACFEIRIDRGRIENVHYRSMIQPVARVEIKALPCKFDSNVFVKAILNGMQNLNSLYD